MPSTRAVASSAGNYGANPRPTHDFTAAARPYGGGMTTETRTHEPAGGDGLFFIIATAIILVVGLEALFIAFTSWWLMGLVLALAVAAAIGVCSALVRLVDDGTPIPSLQRRSQPEPAPAPAAAVRRAPAPSHRTAVTH